MEIWAHRTRASPIEIGNSRQGLIYLYRAGITCIETDICHSWDGKPIIYHPGSIKPDLICYSYAELRNSVFNIMDLDELMGMLKTLDNVSCLLDIKQNSFGLVGDAVRAITANGLEERVYLTAFQKRLVMFNIESDARLLTFAKTLNSAIKTHLIVMWPVNLPKIVAKYRPDIISIGWLQESLLSRLLFATLGGRKASLKKQIREVNRQGVKVLAGIFNDLETIEKFVDLGVDGIVTDCPELMMKVLTAKNTP